MITPKQKKRVAQYCTKKRHKVILLDDNVHIVSPKCERIGKSWILSYPMEIEHCYRWDPEENSEQRDLLIVATAKLIKHLKSVQHPNDTKWNDWTTLGVAIADNDIARIELLCADLIEYLNVQWIPNESA